MTTKPRIRHSVLFTPGTRPERITKAINERTADVVVADLEDAVPIDKKESSRTLVRDAIGTPRTDVERWVRVNTWASGLARADLEVVVAAQPDAIVIPKTESRVALEVLDVVLDRLERRAGIARSKIQLVPIIESAMGVGNVRNILRASPRITAVAFGAEDLAADAGLRRSTDNSEVHAARSLVALAAAERGIDAIDQVFVDLEDVDGIEREARRGRALGYRGKMVLHPRQVAPVHAAFAPAEADVVRARSLLDAAAKANISAGGVLQFEGTMVDVPLIEQARRLVDEAEGIAAKRAT